MPKENAKELTYARGWKFFKFANADITVGEINVKLQAEDLLRVAERMYKHYAAMWKSGWRGKYVPINHFSVLCQYNAWPPEDK